MGTSFIRCLGHEHNFLQLNQTKATKATKTNIEQYVCIFK